MVRQGVAIAVLGFALCACDDSSTTALFAVPGTATAGDFYDLPFPNDLRRTESGALDLSEFPTNALLVEQMRTAASELDGFGLNSAMFARFDGALDPASLPDPAGSIEPTSSVYLVNVDADSPDRGSRTPILAKFRALGTQTLGGNHLVVRPYPGFPLDEGTTYALVITTRVKGDGGGSIGVAPAMSKLVGKDVDPAIVHARTVYQPLLDFLDEAGDDERDDVATAAVFTTQHATSVAEALRKGVAAAPAPVPTDIAVNMETTLFTVFTGNYIAPNFQAGDVPYKNSPSGRITVGTDGVATMQRMEPLRFSLVVPAGPVPPNGFPIAIYSHGTGGDYLSGYEDGTAERLSAEGIATISMDQVLHGPRNPGGNPELDFFNFGNVYAARDNALQGYADAFSQLRLARAVSFTDTGRTIVFDMTKVFFFGHSQGGLTGPGFVAFEPELKGAVLSGTAGLLYLNLLNKTMPLNIPALVETFLRDEPVDVDNPSLALVQMWVERSDPANYAPLMVRRPPPGIAPRPIFQTEGFTDTYSPNVGIEAFATALGGDIVKEAAQKPVEGLELRGRTVQAVPITNNLNGVTAVLAQFNQRPGSDGHFVVFDISTAKQQAARFLGTLASTGQATVVPAN
jgi:hypothetical protein